MYYPLRRSILPTFLRKQSSMASKTYSGHLLCAIPFPEPKTVIEDIQRSHPNLKVTFIQTRLLQSGTQKQNLPIGNAMSHTLSFE